MTFQEVEERFKHKLNEFAQGGYKFSDNYTLYKQSQQEGFQHYLDGIYKGKKHGYIELPTGVGKTALFIALIKNYLDAANGAENAPRVLIAVPTEKLAVQTAQAFAKFLPDIAKTLEADGNKGQEIDWQNSDIGLQYGKIKHAHKKPRVLITTYQSLDRDAQNKTYSPDDFGFVIYDEGHVITAPSFGRAVNKFHDSIQLAVTATPEYSETKAVASRLPYRYFQLSLADGINRGDLCNVRPAIIKTGYKIDEAMFRRFMEQQNGAVLNAQQLQQLLNQEARNKAVIETYMRGSDPDSGERYFGQNGMVFCTGIKHADSIAAQFTKAMGQGEGAKLKTWLDRENIELIASIHGSAKGQWLKKGLIPDASADTRQYQGNREWYSEEEIFALHEKGKILLLASVAKLKAGYDSPRDSLLFDLGDRFSKLDATQIDGRAFRLDPENPHKTATVFNLMDENTQELYAKYPQIIPIYCAEVLEGAEFRLPAKRKNAQIRFKEQPPGMDESLQQAGFDIITNIDAVRTISRANKAKREEAQIKIPPAPEGWKSANMLFKQYVGKKNTFDALLEKKRKQLLAEGLTEQEVREHWVGMYQSGNATLYCSPQAIASFNLTPLAEKNLVAPDGWKTIGALAKEHSRSFDYFRERFKNLNDEKISEGLTDAEIQERWIKKYSSGSGPAAYYVSPSAIQYILENIKPPAPKGWKTKFALELEHVGGSEQVERKMLALRERKLAEGLSPQEVEDNWIGTYVSASHKVVLHASPQAIEYIKQTRKAVTPLGWKSGKMLEEHYSGGRAKFNEKFQEFARLKEKEGIPIDDIQNKYIGTYTASKGATTLFASPEAIGEMASLGLLVLRKEEIPLRPEAWKSGAMLNKDFIGEAPKLTSLIREFCDKKRAEGVSDDIVQKQWAGIYRSVSGAENVYASPITIETMKNQGILRSRLSINQDSTFAERIGKRSIAPGSPDLKRTDREPGKDG